jgi:hypothetical protein
MVPQVAIGSFSSFFVWLESRFSDPASPDWFGLYNVMEVVRNDLNKDAGKRPVSSALKITDGQPRPNWMLLGLPLIIIDIGTSLRHARRWT